MSDDLSQGHAAADAIARKICGNVRRTRIGRGMSQKTLGQVAGVSFQQVQKYEAGRTRIAADVLVLFAARLAVPVAELLDVGDERSALDPANPLTGEAERLLAAFARIDDPTQRGGVLTLAETLASGGPL